MAYNVYIAENRKGKFKIHGINKVYYEPLHTVGRFGLELEIPVIDDLTGLPIKVNGSDRLLRALKPAYDMLESFYRDNPLKHHFHGEFGTADFDTSTNIVMRQGMKFFLEKMDYFTLAKPIGKTADEMKTILYEERIPLTQNYETSLLEVRMPRPTNPKDFPRIYSVMCELEKALAESLQAKDLVPSPLGIVPVKPPHSKYGYFLGAAMHLHYGVPGSNLERVEGLPGIPDGKYYAVFPMGQPPFPAVVAHNILRQYRPLLLGIASNSIYANDPDAFVNSRHDMLAHLRDPGESLFKDGFSRDLPFHIEKGSLELRLLDSQVSMKDAFAISCVAAGLVEHAMHNTMQNGKSPFFRGDGEDPLYIKYPVDSSVERDFILYNEQLIARQGPKELIMPNENTADIEKLPKRVAEDMRSKGILLDFAIKTGLADRVKFGDVLTKVMSHVKNYVAIPNEVEDVLESFGCGGYKQQNIMQSNNTKELIYKAGDDFMKVDTWIRR